jgi:hypothetical protein
VDRAPHAATLLPLVILAVAVAGCGATPPPPAPTAPASSVQASLVAPSPSASAVAASPDVAQGPTTASAQPGGSAATGVVAGGNVAEYLGWVEAKGGTCAALTCTLRRDGTTYTISVFSPDDDTIQRVALGAASATGGAIDAATEASIALTFASVLEPFVGDDLPTVATAVRRNLAAPGATVDLHHGYLLRFPGPPAGRSPETVRQLDYVAADGAATGKDSFGAEADAVIARYEARGFACGDLAQDTRAGYLTTSCRLTAALRTYSISLATDEAGALGDARAEVSTKAGGAVAPNDALAHLDGFVRGVVARKVATQAGSWLASNLGADHAEVPLTAELTMATYTGPGNDPSLLGVDVASAAYLAAPQT